MASTTTTFQGISLQVTVFIAPKDVPRFWEAFRPVYDRVIAEPECTFFEVYHRSAEEEGVVSLSWVENWSKSKEWLIQHQLTKPYYDEYLAITTPMYVRPREIRVLDRLGPPYVMVKRENGGVWE
ncbi:hypothetical protein M432DRAFT_623847 [Thermoascus aurantiacus ATCC 26904]